MAPMASVYHRPSASDISVGSALTDSLGDSSLSNARVPESLAASIPEPSERLLRSTGRSQRRIAINLGSNHDSSHKRFNPSNLTESTCSMSALFNDDELSLSGSSFCNESSREGHFEQLDVSVVSQRTSELEASLLIALKQVESQKGRFVGFKASIDEEAILAGIGNVVLDTVEHQEQHALEQTIDNAAEVVNETLQETSFARGVDALQEEVIGRFSNYGANIHYIASANPFKKNFQFLAAKCGFADEPSH